MKIQNKILTMSFAILILLVVNMIFVSAVTVNEVRASPDQIAPGETARISITIENILSDDVKDVSVSLDFTTVPFGPYDSSNEQSVDEIRDGRLKTFDFEVIALTDSKSGIYKIPIKISYFDSDGIKHDKSSVISMTINSEPILDVEAEDSLLLKGQKNTLTLRIVNKGLSDVKFLDLEIKESTRYSLLSSNKIYIGTIDNDDFETQDIDIIFKDTSASKINLPITLIYKDITNKQYTEDFEVELKVYSTEQALQIGLIQKSYTTTVIFVIVLVIIIYLIYRAIKKRILKKKTSAESN